MAGLLCRVCGYSRFAHCPGEPQEGHEFDPGREPALPWWKRLAGWFKG